MGWFGRNRGQETVEVERKPNLIPSRASGRPEAETPAAHCRSLFEFGETVSPGKSVLFGICPIEKVRNGD